MHLDCVVGIIIDDVHVVVF